MGVKIRERPKESGVWWIFVNHQGMRKSKKVGRDKRLALETAKKLEAKLTLNDLNLVDEKKKAPVFKEYAELWLYTYIKPLRRQATFERYRDVLKRYVYPKFEKVPLDQIFRRDVRDLLLSIFGRGLSKSTVCLVRDVISGVFNHAIEDELVTLNPVAGVVKRLKLTRDKETEIEPLTKAEVSTFLETCRQCRPDYYPFFLTAFRTGMRLGEILAIQWNDIDWNGRFIRVSKSFKRGTITPTKTGKSRRVDMSDQLTETLRLLYTQRKKEALREGSAEIAAFIFHEKNKQPLSQNTVRYVFKRILHKAGLREIRFHDTRHTYASLLLSEGQSPVYVKEQLGHSSIQMTVDIYGHLIPGSNRGAVNQLDETQPSATYPQPAQKQKA